MDGYAPAYVAHNIPFLVVSGLGTPPQDATKTNGPGIRLGSELPLVNTGDARILLSHFKERDGTGLAWNSRTHTGRDKFRIKLIGRVAKPTR
jgi:hypothetical protein